MDAAKRFALWKEQSPTEWLRAANRFLPPAVSGVLVIAIAYQLATLTWTMAPGESWDTPLPAVAPSGAAGGSADRNADYGALRQSHLFGEAPPPEEIAPAPVEEALEAPDTTLSLRLTGITYAEGGDKSLAHIASDRGTEKVYGVGQTIENAGGATLHSVYSDRVILNRGGRLEALRLPRETTAGAAPRASSPLVAAPPPVASSPGSLREVISANASRLTDILRIAPHVDGGQVVGFRVTPGRDREAFTALGLQPGDVVTDINGTVLNDASRGLEAFEALGESTMANVTVLRDGVPQVLVIDMSQVQNLEENRE